MLKVNGRMQTLPVGGNILKDKVFSNRNLYITAIIVAVALIAVGIFGVWRAFARFDETIMTEKDDQIYSLMRSDDINIENSINAFERETETFLSRQMLKEALRVWNSQDDTSDLRDFISENTLQTNPIYADLVVMKGDRIVLSATGKKSYEFITTKDAKSIRLCRDEDGRYYLAYEHDGSGGVSYEALIDLEQLYATAIGTNPEKWVMLVDSTTNVMITPDYEGVRVRTTGDEVDESAAACRDYLLRCQQSGAAGGISMDLKDADGKTYTARVVAQPSGGTVNGEFALGVIINYEEAVAPSRAAAREILIYGGLAVIGVLGLLFLLVFMSRANASTSAELNVLKKKNEALEEINRKMQALTHHQRLETIGTMTASIAHDFNNLLTPIMGYSIMTMEMLPADATDLQENLMEVYNASVKAKDIVTRLSELSKKGSEENYSDVDIDETIQSALKVTLPAKPENVEVKAHFGADGTLIRADRTQISQLVMNIVLNAYDALRENGGSIMVSTRKAGDEIIMRFKDTGCGMDAETVTKIFDPFYTTKESGKGTGLGLAIVAQIVETHGGRIYVDSEPGKGTEFRISLPVAGTDIETPAWGPNGEGKFDTKRYSANLFRKELAKAEAERKRLEEENS